MRTESDLISKLFKDGPSTVPPKGVSGEAVGHEPKNAAPADLTLVQVDLQNREAAVNKRRIGRVFLKRLTAIGGKIKRIPNFLVLNLSSDSAQFFECIAPPL